MEFILKSIARVIGSLTIRRARLDDKVLNDAMEQEGCVKGASHHVSLAIIQKGFCALGESHEVRDGPWDFVIRQAAQPFVVAGCKPRIESVSKAGLTQRWMG